MSDLNFSMDRLSPFALSGILQLDQNFVGTPNYMGFAYFWGHEYKHDMREATQHQRMRIHAAFLDAGLVLSDASAEHWATIKRVLRIADGNWMDAEYVAVAS